MRNFKRKLLSFMLAILMVSGLVINGMTVPVFAQQVSEPEQAAEQTDTENSEPEQAPEQSGAENSEPEQTPEQSGAENSEPEQAPEQSGAENSEPEQAPKQSGAENSEPEQAPEQTGAENSEPEQAPDQTGAENSAPVEEGISLASVGAEDAKDTAVVVAPNQLALDGSKAYLIFTPCVPGAHTYAIGADGTATEDLGIAREGRTPGSTVYLAQKGLGWSLKETENGLVIECGGRYLIVDENEESLVISESEVPSGLVINSNGALSLASGATKTVYLQLSSSEAEPQEGQQFKIASGANSTVFYFAEIQAEPEPPKEFPFEELLPQADFLAEIVSPNEVYGDEQYVIFTEKDGAFYAINGEANCSSPLNLDNALVGEKLSSPDRNVLWTVNNNREMPVEGGYRKYIRSCASNQYLTAEGVLDENISCDFFLSDKNGNSALIATEDGRYLTLSGDSFVVTTDKTAASRFCFAKILLKEQQDAADKETAEVPQGNLFRIVDWNEIAEGKTYAIISATELNALHYPLSGNGRLPRCAAENLTHNSICPDADTPPVYGPTCEAYLGDIFYSVGQDILWTVSSVSGDSATFQNVSTKLFLSTSDGVAAEQTPSISADPDEVSIHPVEGQNYAYLSNGNGTYLGSWQYIVVGVSENADERCAYYLAELIDSGDINNLPETAVEKDSDRKTVSFGGLYSIYQSSQHLITDGTGVQSFILMDDGKEGFKPSSTEFSTEGKNNYYVTYCADYETDMPTFTTPGKYKATSLEDYEGFTPEQKAALQAIIPNCYPYVTEEEFLSNLKEAGYEVSENCGVDEIMAGIQSAIYTVTNPREDGEVWGYDSSESWAHRSYEANKTTSYVSDPEKAENDVNTVRDYLWSLVTKASTTAAGEGEAATKLDTFAITTEIDGETWALTNSVNDYGSLNYHPFLSPYYPGDISQLWYEGEDGFIHWYPTTKTVTKYESYKNNYLTLDFHLSAKNGSLQFSSDGIRLYTNYRIRDVGYSYWDKDTYYCYGEFPMEFEDDHFTIYDPEHKMKNEYLEKLGMEEDSFNYPSFAIEDDNYYSDRKKLVHNGVYKTPDHNGVCIFKKEKVDPVLPEGINYDLESLDWKTNYNSNGTAYDLTISGSLTAPIREHFDDVNVNLYCNGGLIGPVKFAANQKDFTITTNKPIPDSDEAHFWIRIEEKCIDVTVFEPTGQNGWQLQIGGAYNLAIKEIHEDTTSIPVEKVWADDKDHSGDSVELCLVENGKETIYKTTLTAKDGWKGAFKHVPNRRWTYASYPEHNPDEPYYPFEQVEIPILEHEYTMKELNVKPGYTPTYDYGEQEQDKNPSNVLTPGKERYTQVVFTPEGGEPLAIDLDSNGSFKFAEYVPGKESQKLLLNGDCRLLLKVDYRGQTLYQVLSFEPAAEEGKYNLYMEIKQYNFKIYLGFVNNELTECEKADAAALELRDPDTGKPYEKFPEDSSKPVQAALEYYKDGKGSGVVFSFDGYSDPSLVSYSSDDPNQKLEIYYTGTEFITIPVIFEPEYTFKLEPCDEAGQYLLRLDAYGSYPTEYVFVDENSGRINTTENRDEASHFGLKDPSYVLSNNQFYEHETFTVTNAPSPEPPDPPKPSDTVTIEVTPKHEKTEVNPNTGAEVVSLLPAQAVIAKAAAVAAAAVLFGKKKLHKG